MHVLFEEDGAFRAGTVMSDAGTTLQVELPTGKRSKLKSAQVMLRFAEPDPSEFMQQAQRVAEDIDLDFLWECAPQDEFGFTDLAAEYFGAQPRPVEAGGLLMRVHGAPVYFHRKGKGRYRPAPPDILKAALAAVEKRRQQAQAIEEWAQALAERRLPEPIAARAAELLVRPDKNSTEWKALDRACQLAHAAPQALLLAAGAFGSPRGLHVEKFRAEHFPAGFGFGPHVAEAASAAEADWRAAIDALPLSDAVAFSIDDSTTTEIDDCLSIAPLADGRLRMGIHIACPGLAIRPGDLLDKAGRARMSTVYMPGEKITMLPDEAVARFSLDAGREVPALSLYLELAADGTTIVAQDSRAERIRVADNLRHDALDEVVTEAALDGSDAAAAATLDARLPHAAALRALWRVTLALSAERERVRGKPEPRGRADFSFYVEAGTAPDGSDDRVRIVQRRRDAPLDRIVAEAAILANSRWGRLLADRGAPGIYRSQQAMGRVRMGTHPLPHQGLGVAQYAWCTSPLRRYVDLVNQRQLLAVLSGGKPPYAPQDADLFAVIGAFDAKYAAYAEHQQRMERYWCLRWIAQEGLARLEAVVVREDLLRLARAPFFFRLAGVPALAPGRRVLVDVLGTDEVALELSARFVGTVEGAADALEPVDEEALADEALVAEALAAAGAGGEASEAAEAVVEAVEAGEIAPPDVESLAATIDAEGGSAAPLATAFGPGGPTDAQPGLDSGESLTDPAASAAAAADPARPAAATGS